MLRMMSIDSHNEQTSNKKAATLVSQYFVDDLNMAILSENVSSVTKVSFSFTSARRRSSL